MRHKQRRKNQCLPLSAPFLQPQAKMHAEEERLKIQEQDLLRQEEARRLKGQAAP